MKIYHNIVNWQTTALQLSNLALKNISWCERERNKLEREYWVGYAQAIESLYTLIKDSLDNDIDYNIFINKGHINYLLEKHYE